MVEVLPPDIERYLYEIEATVERSAAEGRVDTAGLVEATGQLVDAIARAFNAITIRIPGPVTATSEETPAHRVEHEGKIERIIPVFWDKGKAKANIEVKLINKAIRRTEAAPVELTVKVFRFRRSRVEQTKSHYIKYDPGLQGLIRPRTTFSTSFDVRVVESVWDNNWLLNAIRDALAQIMEAILELAGAEQYSYLIAQIASIATIETLRAILKRLFDLQEGFYFATYEGKVYWPPGPVAVEKFSIYGPVYGVAVAVKTSGIIPAIAERVLGAPRWRQYFIRYARRLGEALLKRIEWPQKTTSVKLGPTIHMVSLIPDVMLTR